MGKKVLSGRLLIIAHPSARLREHLDFASNRNFVAIIFWWTTISLVPGGFLTGVLYRTSKCPKDGSSQVA